MRGPSLGAHVNIFHNLEIVLSKVEKSPIEHITQEWLLEKIQ